MKDHPSGSWHLSKNQHSLCHLIVVLASLQMGDLQHLTNATLALFLQAYLTDFLCQFAQQPCYIMFSGHLNDNERRVLQTIGI